MMVQQRTLDGEIAAKSQKTLEELLWDIDVGYACRALMREGKGMDTMARIHAFNPERHAKLMAAAREILNEQLESDVNPPEL